ncbi:MAG TPA: 50S ribosomal protein L25 [Flavobacteriales bacterium]|nr:50S ribosomal protein L25 [Flavobacteriales bacterium]HIO16357.1 50S ribosomal protein L25 [Flavobacteriales bacterium]HIO59159.1 50S ribosomal protein L25 [Flavobacteriales bacterium]
MKTASLSGSLRENVGKKDASTARKSGSVPGVLYGGQTQTHFTVDEVKLSKLVINPEVFAIELDTDGKKVLCIIQEVQFHPVTDRIVHVDFLEVIPGKPVRVNLPVRAEGTALGVINGGRMEILFRRLPVMGLFENLPDALSADVSHLKIGDSMRIGDINLEGCRILLNDDVLLFACKRTRLALVEETELGEGEEGEEMAEGAEGAEGSEGTEGEAGSSDGGDS